MLGLRAHIFLALKRRRQFCLGEAPRRPGRQPLAIRVTENGHVATDTGPISSLEVAAERRTRIDGTDTHEMRK